MIKFLRKLLRIESKETMIAKKINKAISDSYEKGLLDVKTGRRVDIDPETRKKVFVDGH